MFQLNGRINICIIGNVIIMIIIMIIIIIIIIIIIMIMILRKEIPVNNNSVKVTIPKLKSG